MLVSEIKKKKWRKVNTTKTKMKLESTLAN